MGPGESVGKTGRPTEAQCLRWIFRSAPSVRPIRSRSLEATSTTGCGRAWTANDGSQISPPCSERGACFDGNLCIEATIPPRNQEEGTYPGVFLGISAHDSGSGDSGTWISEFDTITPFFAGTGVTGEVRLILQGRTEDYCARVVQSGVPITRDSFKSQWWDDAWAVPIPEGEPVLSVMI